MLFLPLLSRYSTWPWDYESNPNNDGVVFLYSTVPGGETKTYSDPSSFFEASPCIANCFHEPDFSLSGDAEDYNQGKTLVSTSASTYSELSFTDTKSLYGF